MKLPSAAPSWVQTGMTTILLVDDEDLLREGVQEILEHNGYTVVQASTGHAALQYLAQASVSLVISDLVMPEMNGVDFVRQVRERFPDLPIIVASGSTGAVMARMGIDSIGVPGATASLMKPFRSADLLAQVRQVLSEAAP